MKKILVIALLSVTVFLPGTAAAANIIVNGDFNSVGGILNQPYIAGTSTDGLWLGNNRWTIQPTGGISNSPYADHESEGNMLYQGINAPVNGTSVNISLDYIYETGIISTETTIRVFGLDTGEGLGTFNNFIGSPTLLYTSQLAIHSDWYHFDGGSFLVNGNYDSLLFTVFANAFGPNIVGLRGIDDVYLGVASVPEPSTLLLLGSGLLGLLGYGRKLMKK